MRRSPRLVVCALAVFAFPLAALARSPRVFPEQSVEGATLRYHGDIPVVTLRGAPAEIGRQHALLLAETSRKIANIPLQFADEYGLAAFVPLMGNAGRTLMANVAPRHREELAAIAEHGGVDEELLIVANTLLELRRLGCSSIIVESELTGGLGPLFGRNFDFETFGVLDSHSLLLVYHPEGRRAFASIGFPGIVGALSGINDAGLAVATLDVEQSADGSPKLNPVGAPLAFVFRRILEECQTVDEAERLLKSIEATTWMNLAVCDPRGGAVFEITPRNVARRSAVDHLLCCTNHFRADGLAVGETCDRYDSLQQLPRGRAVGVREVQDRLHAAHQSRFTFQTMVFEPRTLTLHLALGPPPSSDDKLTRIDLKPLFERD